MKQIVILWMFAASLLGFAACDTLNQADDAAEGTLSVSLCGMKASITTKAAATDAEAWEEAVNSVQLFLFSDDGSLYKYHVLSSAEITAAAAEFDRVKTGAYTVAAVLNSQDDLSSVATLEALHATATSLGDNSTTVSSGFLMYGEISSVSVTGSGGTANVEVYRFPARVTLVSVTNAVAGGAKTVDVKAAILINGFGAWKLATTDSPTEAVNPAGESGGSIILSADDADYGELTFAGFGASGTSVSSSGTAFGNRFYSFPKAAVQTDRFGSETGGNVRLSVLASVNGGADTWYPVTLPEGIERNKAYDIRLTITGAGSDHPNTPVVSGTLSASITVKDWTSGGEYTETI